MTTDGWVGVWLFRLWILCTLGPLGSSVILPDSSNRNSGENRRQRARLRLPNWSGMPIRIQSDLGRDPDLRIPLPARVAQGTVAFLPLSEASTSPRARSSGVGE